VYSTSPRNVGWVRPGALYSALVGVTARTAVPSFLRRAAYQMFARVVGADLSEADQDLRDYRTFGEMFARRLQPGLRTVEGGESVIVSPCDGRIAAAGSIHAGTLIQAKGREYTVAELVADDDLAAQLHDGRFLTVYLSPRDYHRVHVPVAGSLTGYRYLPGTLWPVSARFAQRVDRLLARNERAVVPLQTEYGLVVVVLVGAAGVGNLWLSMDDHETRGWRQTFGWAEPKRVELPPTKVQRGDEIGAFYLGSTVIMLLPEKAKLKSDLIDGGTLRMGQAVADWESF
jgi:phosphatidylserine decarboxylase